MGTGRHHTPDTGASKPLVLLDGGQRDAIARYPAVHEDDSSIGEMTDAITAGRQRLDLDLDLDLEAARLRVRRLCAQGLPTDATPDVMRRHSPSVSTRGSSLIRTRVIRLPETSTHSSA